MRLKGRSDDKRKAWRQAGSIGLAAGVAATIWTIWLKAPILVSLLFIGAVGVVGTFLARLQTPGWVVAIALMLFPLVLPFNRYWVGKGGSLEAPGAALPIGPGLAFIGCAVLLLLYLLRENPE